MSLLIRPYHPAFPSLMDSMMEEMWENRGLQEVAANLYETSDSVKVELAIPSYLPEHISINSVGNSLTITGERKEAENKEERTYHRKEIRTNRFSESFTLPSGVKASEAKAEFSNGILVVSLPKAEEAKPRQIEITMK